MTDNPAPKSLLSDADSATCQVAAGLKERINDYFMPEEATKLATVALKLLRAITDVAGFHTFVAQGCLVSSAVTGETVEVEEANALADHALAWQAIQSQALIASSQVNHLCGLLASSQARTIRDDEALGIVDWFAALDAYVEIRQAQYPYVAPPPYQQPEEGKAA